MTISDAFAVRPTAAGAAARPAAASDAPHVHARMRTRGSILHRVTAWAEVMWVDLRSAWFLPASIPTVTRAWAGRMPNRERVPGNSDALYWGWVAYNHTIGLAVPAAAVAAIGLLTPAVWIILHPARFALAALLAVPLVATAVAFTT